MIWRVGQYSAFSYHGGLVLLSIATVGVVAATALPGTVVGLALGWRAAALDRRPLLRHLPVALSGDRADHAGEHQAKPGQGRGPGRRGNRHRGTVLEIRGGTNQARRDRAPLGEGRARPDRRAPPLPAAGLGRLTNVGGLAATAGVTGVLVMAGVGLSGAVRAPPAGSQRIAGLSRLAELSPSPSRSPTQAPSTARQRPRSPQAAGTRQAGRCARPAARSLTSATPPRTAWSRRNICPTRSSDRGQVRRCRRADRRHRRRRAPVRSSRHCPAR